MSTADDLAIDTAEVKDTATARKYFDIGSQAEQEGQCLSAIEAYEAAYTADPDDPQTCFRLAYCLDLLGEADEALHLYEECSKCSKPHLNALINLAILYEDSDKYAQAERCVRQVLATEPNHARARLYIKDILASKAMLIDDEQERRDEKHHALLDTPVTDFELTVRTRNALRKMNVRTLGDLLKITESEIRSFKNFGDASLDEIKSMLAQKGLRLGQAVEQHQEEVKQQIYDQLKGTEGNEELLARTVNEINLSVRARKALAMLNIVLIGDLCFKTEAELMGVKNFGMTSLVEVKERLTDMGLGLRELDS
jgi:DNA-directed RNA polymerase subunit alpha